MSDQAYLAQTKILFDIASELFKDARPRINDPAWLNERLTNLNAIKTLIEEGQSNEQLLLATLREFSIIVNLAAQYSDMPIGRVFHARNSTYNLLPYVVITGLMVTGESEDNADEWTAEIDEDFVLTGNMVIK